MGGTWGTVLGGLTAAKSAAKMRGKPRPHGPGPANRRHVCGVQKGEVNLTTPNTSELLVQQAQEAERLRLLLLAKGCKDLDEFCRELEKRLNKQ